MENYTELSQSMDNALEMNNYDEFFSICDIGINSNFSNKEKAQIYFMMASAYRDLNELTNALKAYTSAMNLDKDKLYAYIRKAEILRELGRIEPCVYCCLQGLDVFPNDDKLISIKQSVEQYTTSIKNDNLKQNIQDVNSDDFNSKQENMEKPINNDINTPFNNKNQNTLIESVNDKNASNYEVNNSKIYEDCDDYEESHGQGSNILKTLCKVLICIILLLGVGVGSFFGYKAIFIKESDNKDVAASLNKEDKDNKDVKENEKQEQDQPKQEAPKEVKQEKRLINNNKMRYLVKNEDPNAPFSSYAVGNPSYIFPESDRAKLKYEDAINKTLDELFIARNEIFARHGYMFERNSILDSYFKNKPWYKPLATAQPNTNNDIEAFNADLIRQVEVARIAHYNYGDNGIDGYVIEDSNTRKITNDELKNLRDWEIIVARNEIFARHGFTFAIPQLDDHFLNQIWYKKGGFNEKDVTSLESENAELLAQEENSRYNKILKR